jgi:hypothetical protein
MSRRYLEVKHALITNTVQCFCMYNIKFTGIGEQLYVQWLTQSAYVHGDEDGEDEDIRLKYRNVGQEAIGILIQFNETTEWKTVQQA